jgi:hypothetical protein
MPTILVVEDEFAIAELLEMALTDAGYEVLTAANGRQALERMAEAPRPDLIITDFMMPVLNAAGLVEALRNDAAYRNIPVCGDELRSRGECPGASQWIPHLRAQAVSTRHDSPTRGRHSLVHRVIAFGTDIGGLPARGREFLRCMQHSLSPLVRLP